MSGSSDCKIKLWSATTGECIRTLVGHDHLVRALSFDPPTGRLVSASYDRTVKVWDLRSGKMMREFRNSHVSHIFDVKFDVARIVRYASFMNHLGEIDANFFVVLRMIGRSWFLISLVSWKMQSCLFEATDFKIKLL